MTHATTLQEHWGQRIRAERKRQGLSVNGLARRAEVDAGNLSRVERGLQGTSEEMRQKIAAALNKETDDVFTPPASSGVKRSA